MAGSKQLKEQPYGVVINVLSASPAVSLSDSRHCYDATVESMTRPVKWPLSHTLRQYE